jgi:hypothetical protein
MFWDSSDGIEVFTTSVTGLVILITGNTSTELKVRTATFKERNTNLNAYMKSHYDLRQAIKQAKRNNRTKIESYYAG